MFTTYLHLRDTSRPPRKHHLVDAALVYLGVAHHLLHRLGK